MEAPGEGRPTAGKAWRPWRGWARTRLCTCGQGGGWPRARWALPEEPPLHHRALCASKSSWVCLRGSGRAFFLLRFQPLNSPGPSMGSSGADLESGTPPLEPEQGVPAPALTPVGAGVGSPVPVVREGTSGDLAVTALLKCSRRTDSHPRTQTHQKPQEGCSGADGPAPDSRTLSHSLS